VPHGFGRGCGENAVGVSAGPRGVSDSGRMDETRPRIFARPTPLAAALGQVEAWLASPSAVVLAGTEGYWQALRAALEGGKAAGPLVHDGKVAALCAHHGVRELWSAGRDFGRFSGVRVKNPQRSR